MQLLAVDIGLWVGVGAGVLALAAFLYGIFRRFVRVSWLSWQIWITFACALLLAKLPAFGNAGLNTAVKPLLLSVIAAVVLAAGGVARTLMLRRMKPVGGGLRFLGRVLGGVTSVLNLFTLLVVIAAPVLVALPVFGVEIGALGALYGNPVWVNFGAPYAVDLLLFTLLLLAMRCGYRVGLLRALWGIVTLALGAGAVVLSVYMAIKVPFMAQWSASLAANFASLGSYASVVGTAIMAAICFVILLAVIIVISVFLNKLMKKIRKPTAFRVIDGALLALLFTALFLLLVYGLDFGVYFLAHRLDALPEQLQGIAASAEQIFLKIETFFRASPVAAHLYDTNPFRLIGG